MKVYVRDQYKRKFTKSNKAFIRVNVNNGMFYISPGLMEKLQLKKDDHIEIASHKPFLMIIKAEDGFRVGISSKGSNIGQFCCRTLMVDLLSDLGIPKNGRASVVLEYQGTHEGYAKFKCNDIYGNK